MRQWSSPGAHSAVGEAEGKEPQESEQSRVCRICSGAESPWIFRRCCPSVQQEGLDLRGRAGGGTRHRLHK